MERVSGRDTTTQEQQQPFKGSREEGE